MQGEVQRGTAGSFSGFSDGKVNSIRDEPELASSFPTKPPTFFYDCIVRAGNYLNVSLTLRTMLKSNTCSGDTGCAGLVRTDASAIISR